MRLKRGSWEVEIPISYLALLTAKATKGIHSREVGHWRHYQRHLAEALPQMSDVGVEGS